MMITKTVDSRPARTKLKGNPLMMMLRKRKILYACEIFSREFIFDNLCPSGTLCKTPFRHLTDSSLGCTTEEEGEEEEDSAQRKNKN